VNQGSILDFDGDLDHEYINLKFSILYKVVLYTAGLGKDL